MDMLLVSLKLPLFGIHKGCKAEWNWFIYYILLFYVCLSNMRKEGLCTVRKDYSRALKYNG
jgi:hypothetical protein